MKQQELDAGVHTLSALVQYQAGAVVSRVLLKTDRGSVTLFAFDHGEELSEHTVPHDALVCLLEGRAEITIAGQPHRLEADQTILMPANRPHAVKAVERFKMMLTMLRSDDPT